MKYTFEVTLSGCNNECAHCCVSGGKAAAMPLENFTFGINRLKEILCHIDGEIAITFGNEIFNHSQIVNILNLAKTTIPEYYWVHRDGIPTTGIALLARKDKAEIIEALKELKCAILNLTLHGNREHHKLMTKNENTFDSVLGAASLIKNEGFPLEFNLMLNKHLVIDWDTVADVVKPYHAEYVHITVPSYLPVDRLREFQKYRAEYDDCLNLKGKLSCIGINEDEFFRSIEMYCEQNIAKSLLQLKHFAYSDEDEKMPKWNFFNVTQNLDVYHGNAGLHTRLIGNLRSSGVDEIRSEILDCSANYDWSAYYDVNALPGIQEVLQRIQPLETNYIYSSVADCIYSWFDRLGIGTRLIRQS
jgi:MoaA/NifB/PqqE/SkfB family radical SAM enzyme